MEQELKTKTAERQNLSHEYTALKKEVDEVYKIQRNVRDILDDERLNEEPQKSASADWER